MINHYEIYASGIEGILFMLFFSFLMCILFAARVGGKDLSAHYMVKIKKSISIFLFLFVLKRKVSIWPIIMQVLNYTVFIAAIVTYKLFNLNNEVVDKTFAIIIGGYMGGSYHCHVISRHCVCCEKQRFLLGNTRPLKEVSMLNENK